MKDKLYSMLYVLIIGAPFIVGIILIVLWIIALISYGDKPVTEIPSWAFFLLNNKR